MPISWFKALFFRAFLRAESQVGNYVLVVLPLTNAASACMLLLEAATAVALETAVLLHQNLYNALLLILCDCEEGLSYLTATWHR